MFAGSALLQTAAIVAGLPFTIVLVPVCVGVWRALESEARGRERPGGARPRRLIRARRRRAGAIRTPGPG